MINIDLQNDIAEIKQPTNKRELFILESEMMYILGNYLNAKEEFENKTFEPQEIMQMLQTKIIMAKAFFAGIKESQDKKTANQ
ncbi:hypothetical protein Hc94105_0228 [Helicobacter cinaedi]|uniref:hypothetical protein n=1 Tax=Helicobacter cinaedi TaxID=213 RepID=UPI001F1CC664|nr:hypothetical protein [Helicobacter cinaedi]BDB66043.1 hypothetical protein Hc94105_0228 [Helicobacter cinaedi]